MNKKTIWITGGSTGIGKALAIKFANVKVGMLQFQQDERICLKKFLMKIKIFTDFNSMLLIRQNAKKFLNKSKDKFQEY